jgi:methyl-accepting chemotaxis protein
VIDSLKGVATAEPTLTQASGLTDYTGQLRSMASEVAATSTNQPTGAECRNRGCPCWRNRSWFRRGRRCGPRPVEPSENRAEDVTVDINSAITRLVEVTDTTAESDNQSVVTSEANIRHVLDRLTTLRSACLARPYVQQESADIRDEISEVLVALQFQDRSVRSCACATTWMPCTATRSNVSTTRISPD